MKGPQLVEQVSLPVGMWIKSLALGLTLSATIFGAPTLPCTAGAANETILPVRNSLQTYCVSDYGWSDSWFVGTPANYVASLDIMSGDDSPALRWSGGATGPGNGWLTHSMDQGTLSPRTVTSGWSIVTPLAYVTPGDQTQTRSVISHSDGLRVTITTDVSGLQVHLTFAIQNTGAATLTNLQFADYFNFHTNGSASDTAKRLGTSTYLGANGIKAVGTKGVSSYVADGRMFGERIDDRHAMGVSSFTGGTQPNCGTSNCLWQQVQSNSWNGLTGPVGPSDSAGALQWDLGSLAPGQSTSFMITKELIDPIPEPSTWVLIGSGAGLIGFSQLRRRRR